MAVLGLPQLTTPVTIIDDGKYNAFPDMCVHTGVLWCVYRTADTHTSINGQIAVQKSTNGGPTWGAQTIIAPTPPAGHDWRDPCIVNTRTGKEIIAHMDYPSGGPYPEGPYVMTSTDGGGAFTSTALLTLASGFTQSCAPMRFLQHSTGPLVMSLYGQDTGDTDDRPAFTRSTDDAVTWGSVIRAGTASCGLSESGLIELADGSIHALLRSSTDPGSIWDIHSTDVGLTWSSPAALSLGFSVTPGHPGTARMPVSGTTVIFYRHTGGSATYWTYSEDDLATWAPGILFSSDTYVYAGGVPLVNDFIGFAVSTQQSVSVAKIQFVGMAVGEPLATSLRALRAA